MRAQLEARKTAALEACDAKFPQATPAVAVDRARCVNDAMNIIRPVLPYPDLLDVMNATNLSVSERYQNKQLTYAQAAEIMTAKRSELVGEEQRRILATRSVESQEAIASASIRATGPRTCTIGGNTVTCF